MIEFDVDMRYLLEADELDCVILNDESGECEPMKFTPELGNGTLTAEQVSKATYAHSIHADCADADWQAIADELNARAERTCRIVEYADAPIPVCSECGAVQPDDYAVYYCWSCGAKVRNE